MCARSKEIKAQARPERDKASKSPLLRGRISIQRQGMGFVRLEQPADNGRPGKSGKADKAGKSKNQKNTGTRDYREVYIAPDELGGAWDGDLVLLTVLRHAGGGKNPEGRVLEVLERRVNECAARLLPQMVREEGRDKFLARSLDIRQSGYLLVDVSGLARERGSDLTRERGLDLVQEHLDGAGPGRLKTPATRPGDLLLVRLLPLDEQKNDGVLRALAVSDLGSEQNLALHERLVKASHGIRTAFPQAVLDEAAHLDDVDAILTSEALPHRDLSDLAFVTLDGADAKDFDDAIFVERTGCCEPDAKAGRHVRNEQNSQTFHNDPDANAGGYLLRVAIADVAHYVPPGGALDLEARARGNSCYFPASVEPMLPEALSNGLCSLQPDKLRLVMVAEIAFDAAGNAGRTEFYPARIRSRARLTYEQAQAALDQDKGTAQKNPADTDIGQKHDLGTIPAADHPVWLPMLRQAAELAARLLEKRRARGALDFELPETLVRLETRAGHQEIQNLVFRERLFTHRLIEEFMIAANEAVARHLAAWANNAFLYRAHPAPNPEKLGEFISIMKRNGLWKPAAKSGLGRDLAGHKSPGAGQGLAVAPRTLQHILEQTRGRPEAFVVGRLLLRSLMQARYTPQAEGHFGLASAAYCHFTSPIRRYADLTVHRALRRSLGLPLAICPPACPEASIHGTLGQPAPIAPSAPIASPAPESLSLPSFQELSVLAESLNTNERKAVEAERDIHKICGALFMQKFEEQDPGREFPARVAGLSSYGLFVELEEFPLEGFLPVERLPEDFYRLDAAAQMLLGLRQGLTYRLGQPLCVILLKADPGRMEVRFALSAEQMRKSGKWHPKKTGKNGKQARSGKKYADKNGGRSAEPGGSNYKTNKKKRREPFKPGSVRLRNKNPEYNDENT